MDKKEMFETFDEIAESIKEPEVKKANEISIEINEERFKEESSRIRDYLGKLSTKKISPFEIISILQDLEVIIETNGLSKDEIIEQLRKLIQGK